MPEPKNTSDPEAGAPAKDKPAKDKGAPADKPAAEVVKQPPPPPAEAERIPRMALSVGAAALMIGLAMVGSGPSDIGRFVALGALITMIYGVHSFGRLGAPG